MLLDESVVVYKLNEFDVVNEGDTSFKSEPIDVALPEVCTGITYQNVEIINFDRIELRKIILKQTKYECFYLELIQGQEKHIASIKLANDFKITCGKYGNMEIINL